MLKNSLVSKTYTSVNQIEISDEVYKQNLLKKRD